MKAQLPTDNTAPPESAWPEVQPRAKRAFCGIRVEVLQIREDPLQDRLHNVRRILRLQTRQPVMTDSNPVIVRDKKDLLSRMREMPFA